MAKPFCNKNTYWSSPFVFNAIRKPGGIVAISDDILLECSRNGNCRDLLVGAMRFICTIGTEFAHSTDTADPFDTSSIAYFPFVMHVVTDRDHDSSSFMPSNAFGLRLHVHTDSMPAAMNESIV
jgi:hypothetical protein